jgi:hypothetical protein
MEPKYSQRVATLLCLLNLGPFNDSQSINILIILGCFDLLFFFAKNNKRKNEITKKKLCEKSDLTKKKKKS